VSLELGAGTAEAMLGGVLINFIPKDGGNKFSGLFSGNFANHTMQASNLSDEVKARGLTELSVNKVHDIWEYNGTLGGPIFEDRLWFFTAHRRWGNSTQVAGIFHNATTAGCSPPTTAAPATQTIFNVPRHSPDVEHDAQQSSALLRLPEPPPPRHGQRRSAPDCP
jgi:hypothetical protein